MTVAYGKPRTDQEYARVLTMRRDGARLKVIAREIGRSPDAVKNMLLVLRRTGYDTQPLKWKK